MNNPPEVWLRGKIDGYPDELQPVVHAVLQAQEEIHALLLGFESNLLWEKPYGVASVAFHLQHIKGVLDRMVTYAKGEALSREQFDYLKQEDIKNDTLTTESLVQNLDFQIAHFLNYIAQINPDTLGQSRGVGRSNLPSTVGGLLFHAAEHTQRHVGQLLVTVRILK